MPRSPPSGATLDLIELLEQAGPIGSGNPAPVFALPAHRVVYADAAGSDHIRCTFAAADGTRIKAIAFRALGTDLGELLLTERQHPLHIVGRLVVDEWWRTPGSLAPYRRCRPCPLRRAPALLALAGEPHYRTPTSRAPFVYRLGRQPFTLQRRVRFP